MNRRAMVLISVLAVVVVLPQCGKKEDSGISADPSFTEEIQPIFNSNCTSSSCHGAGASAGLMLTQDQARSNMVDTDSIIEPSFKRVIPGDAANSYLVMKLEGNQSAGQAMPVSGTLDSDTIQLIKNWINRGAKDN